MKRLFLRTWPSLAVRYRGGSGSGYLYVPATATATAAAVAAPPPPPPLLRVGGASAGSGGSVTPRMDSKSTPRLALASSARALASLPCERSVLAGSARRTALRKPSKDTCACACAGGRTGGQSDTK